LAHEKRIDHTDDPMTEIGAVLGIPHGMTPVTSVIARDLPPKRPATGLKPVGKFSDDADYSPRHVLVVDDEALIRWSVSETLSDLGFDVEQAADAGAALRAVTNSSQVFDVVVLDLRLPDMNDLSLLGTLRQLLPGAILILMTAFATPDIISDAHALGAAVLHKPFELDELKRLLREPGTEVN
jgi:CheY-like chemotaxis protein